VGEPDRDGIRIGDTERGDAMRILGEHFTAGRLQVDEYDVRIAAAMSAVTRADLRPLFTDLPAPYPPFMAPPTWAAPPPVYPSTPAYATPPPMYPIPAPMHYPQQMVPYSDKSRVVAGVLQILLPFGVGRFYTGHYGLAIAQLLTCGGFGVWCLIDGVILLLSGGTDSYGRRLRD
jgi:hypothetical protein